MSTKHFLPIFLAGALSVCADPLVSDRPDYTIQVNIESDPPGAEIYSIPATTNDAPVKIGTTPHVSPVELRWGRGLLRKKWENLSVKTVGNICQLDYFPDAKQYDLAMKFKVVAPGHLDEFSEQTFATFAYYDDLDFDNLKGIPSNATVRVEMKATEANVDLKAKLAPAAD